jgi:plastocyanin
MSREQLNDPGRVTVETRTSKARAGAAVLLAVMLGLTLGACGDDGDETSSSADATSSEAVAETTVTATEWDFELSATPTSETETVTFTNDGEQPHVLVFAKINEGFTIDEAVAAEGKKGTAEEVGFVDAKPGESATLKVKEPLEPGDYAMLCPIPAGDGEFHYDLGQLEEFEIE